MEEKNICTKDIGNQGEILAEKFLIQDGYKILEKNYMCKMGEIDIIAEKDNVIHFVEVKTKRKSQNFIPADSINSKKINHLRKTALRYIQSNENNGKEYCFDLIGIEVQHLENII